MSASRVEVAVQNNVCWYEAMFAAHGLPSFNDGRVWRSDAQPPPFHSNLVVRSPAVSPKEVEDHLWSLEQQARPAGWSMKDSYGGLDLVRIGFGKLFEAHWIWRDASIPPQRVETPTLTWHNVTTPADLAAWEAAWWGDAGHASHARAQRQFPDRLLESPDHVFMAGLLEGRVVAGGVANRSPGAVGLSNVFAPPAHERETWAALVAGTAARFANTPMVGYERGAALDLAQNAGFVPIGALCIWCRSG